MEFDFLLPVALLIAVTMVALWALRLFRPTRITVTVGPGRQLTIGGMPFPPSGPAAGLAGFVVPRSAVRESDGEIVLAIGTSGNGDVTQEIGLSRQRLRTLHVDAALESEIVVYGGYEPTMRLLSYATTPTDGEPRCIWCRGGIIVCGINPQCK